MFHDVLKNNTPVKCPVVWLDFARVFSLAQALHGAVLMNNYDVSHPNCYDVYKLLLLATGVHFKRPMGTWCCMISHASSAACCHMCHRPRVVTCVIDCSFCRQPWRKRTSARNAAQKHPPEVFALPQAWWSLQQRDLLRFGSSQKFLPVILVICTRKLDLFSASWKHVTNQGWFCPAVPQWFWPSKVTEQQTPWVTGLWRGVSWGFSRRWHPQHIPTPTFWGLISQQL